MSTITKIVITNSKIDQPLRDDQWRRIPRPPMPAQGLSFIAGNRWILSIASAPLGLCPPHENYLYFCGVAIAINLSVNRFAG